MRTKQTKKFQPYAQFAFAPKDGDCFRLPVKEMEYEVEHDNNTVMVVLFGVPYEFLKQCAWAMEVDNGAHALTVAIKRDTMLVFSGVHIRHFRRLYKQFLRIKMVTDRAIKLHVPRKKT